MVVVRRAGTGTEAVATAGSVVRGAETRMEVVMVVALMGLGLVVVLLLLLLLRVVVMVVGKVAGIVQRKL